MIRTLWLVAADEHNAMLDKTERLAPGAYNYLTRVANYLECGNKVRAFQIWIKLSNSDRAMVSDYIAEALFNAH